MVNSKTTPKSRKRRELFGTLDYCIPGPVRRIERTYFRRRKQEVLLFLVHHRIPLLMNGIDGFEQPSRVLLGMEDVKEEGFRRPTTLKAKDYFLIKNVSTKRQWWAQRDKIFGGPVPKPYPSKWPALEKELVKQFQAARDGHKIVTVHCFGVYRSRSGNGYILTFPGFSSFQMAGFGGFFVIDAFRRK
jgi:hypothetical protein